jgi:hypothetical protein
MSVSPAVYFDLLVAMVRNRTTVTVKTQEIEREIHQDGRATYAPALDIPEWAF